MSSPLRYALDARVRQLRRGASSSFGVSAVWLQTRPVILAGKNPARHPFTVLGAV